MTSITAVHLARISWALFTEPGDEIAHRLVSFFGPERALELVWSDIRLPTAEQLDAEYTRIASGILWEAGLNVTADELEGAVRRWIPRMRSKALHEEVMNLKKSDVVLVGPEDPEWPSRLNDMGDSAPLLLWSLGDVSLLQQDQIAIVGARAATTYGEHIARELAEDLGRTGFIVTSGGAYGIDAAAHRAAMAVGFKTVAVMAGGLQRYYPVGHNELLTRISQKGLVVSAVPFSCAPTRFRFLARNAIISALSRAVIVVEAGGRSGSLSTANHAVTQGRPVGAVPGPLTSAASVGTNLIIKDGRAKLVTSAEDVENLLVGA